MTMMYEPTAFVRYDKKATMDAALEYTRGVFQHHVLIGYEPISLSALKGKAKLYSGRYRTSLNNLLARLRGAGFDVSEDRGDHRRRILVITR